MHNKKNIYIKPELEVYNVDKEICLVMASEIGPPDPPFSAASPTSEAAEQPATKQSSFNDNPFESKQ